MKHNLYKVIQECVNEIDNKKFGFVSKYKGNHYSIRGKFVEFLDEQQKIMYWKNNDKLELINKEYKAAFSLVGCLNRLIDERGDLVSLTDQEMKDSNFLQRLLCNIEEEDNKRLQVLNKEIRRALDACVRKGYQVPAIKIVSLMAKGLIDGEELVDQYLIAIERNYARKAAYQDKGGYLQSSLFYSSQKEAEANKSNFQQLRGFETTDAYLQYLIVKGEFGIDRQENAQQYLSELRKDFDHVKRSCMTSDSIRIYSKLEDLSQEK